MPELRAEGLRIGLEVHLRLASERKLFSAAPNSSLGEPNARVAPHDAALPGSMPRLNGEALGLGLRLALALGSRIQASIAFDRKHYSYKDLPAGYQVTQERLPLALGGSVALASGKAVGLKGMHLESDAAKTVRSKDGYWLVDYNRCGCPLAEVVTLPEISSLEEMEEAIGLIREAAVVSGASRADMSKGDMRCDINVSSRGMARQEIKNVNSIRFAVRAVAQVLKEGSGSPLSSTWWWDEGSQSVRLARHKEGLGEYLYLEEADLKERAIDPRDVEAEGALLSRRAALASSLARLLPSHSHVLRVMASPQCAPLMGLGAGSPALANLALSISVAVKPITLAQAEAILRWPRAVSERAARAYIEEGLDPGSERLDAWLPERIVEAARASWPGDLEDYLRGNDRALDFLVGKLRAEGVDPRAARRALADFRGDGGKR